MSVEFRLHWVQHSRYLFKFFLNDYLDREFLWKTLLYSTVYINRFFERSIYKKEFDLLGNLNYNIEIETTLFSSPNCRIGYKDVIMKKTRQGKIIKNTQHNFFL